MTDAACAAAVGLVLAACLSETPQTPSVSPSAAGIELPESGRPYEPDAVLDAMRSSRRPGGVPDQIETSEVAAAISDSLWTFDGSPWPELVAGGSCGPQSCTLELAGTPPGALGEDLYVFAVSPAAGTVALQSTNLRGLPAELLAELDAAVRKVWPANRLTGLAAVSARWLPPPNIGEFVVAYRSGGEEGSPGVDVVFEARKGLVVRSTAVE